MADIVEFADIESAVVVALRARLTARGDSARVATRRDERSPARLVRVTRTGGIRASLVEDRPVVTFECWDAGDVAAARLGAIVRAEVQSWSLQAVTLDGVTVFVSWAGEVGGLAYFPHPDLSLSRYQHTQQLAVIGRVV